MIQYNWEYFRDTNTQHGINRENNSGDGGDGGLEPKLTCPDINT